MSLNSFCKRVAKDFKQRELLPLKILFFVHSSTLFVLYPYLTIHMRELGINVEETAIMSAIIPIVTIIMPPLAGMIGDKIGNFKLLLSLSSAIGGIVALLLLLVPVGRITVTYPQRVEMLMGAPSEISSLRLEVGQYPCNPLHPYPFEVEARIESCGFVCEWPRENSNNESLPLDEALSYAIKVKNSQEGTTEVYRYPLGHQDRPIIISMTDQNTVRNWTNNLRYKTALRLMSDTVLFFPSDKMYDFNCQLRNSSDLYCGFGFNDTSNDLGINSKKMMPFYAKLMPLLLDVTRNKTISSEFTIKTIREIKGKDQPHRNVTFIDNFDTGIEEISIELLFLQQDEDIEGDPIGITAQLDNCAPRCLLTTARNEICSNSKDEIELDPNLTFLTYLAVRVFIGIVGGTAFAMFEGAVIAILREHEGDYGLQRIYGSMGGMISSPLSGLLIDYASRNKGYTDFRPAFYLYAVLKVLSGILMMAINLEFKAPASDLVQDVIGVLRNIEILALFMAVFVLGTCWGYIESFLFWLLQDLGASSSLMGVTVTVGSIAGIPLLVLSGPIIDKIGHANVLFIGFLFYTIRLLGYSLIFNPWMCLFFEAMEGVTTSLTFTAAVTYTAKLSTITTDASIQGLMGGMYYGVGRGSGSLIGGYLMKIVGTRSTFRILSFVALVTGIIYFFFNKLYLLKRPNKVSNDICKTKPKDVEKCEKSEKLKNGEKMSLKNSKNDKKYSEECNKDIEKMKTGLDNPTFVENETPSNNKPKGFEEVDLKRSDSIKENEKF